LKQRKKKAVKEVRNNLNESNKNPALFGAGFFMRVKYEVSHNRIG
jgi:hypothetical protein